MALFTDGTLNGLQDLARHESGLLDVTSIEQIDLETKLSLSHDLIAADLFLFLFRQERVYPQWRRSRGVSDVVVTEPLMRWHAFRTLELTYQDAYNNQLNDRYQGKWNQYRELALRAADQLFQIGVGVVADPMERAASPLLVAVSGQPVSYFPASSLYVRMVWINKAGQEGAPSEVVALQTVGGAQLVVSPGPAPSNAASWNVYVGQTPDNTSLQNSVPISTGTDWAMPGSGLVVGKPIGRGQAPERYIVNTRANQRG